MLPWQALEVRHPFHRATGMAVDESGTHQQKNIGRSKEGWEEGSSARHMIGMLRWSGRDKKTRNRGRSKASLRLYLQRPSAHRTPKNGSPPINPLFHKRRTVGLSDLRSRVAWGGCAEACLKSGGIGGGSNICSRCRHSLNPDSGCRARTPRSLSFLVSLVLRIK